MNGFVTACLEWEATEKVKVIHHTFGHLYPEENKIFKGKICATISIYGDIIVIDEDIEINGSPWWFQSVNDFAYETIKDLSQGSIHELEIEAQVVPEEDNENLSNIHIKLINKKTLKEAW